METKLCRIAKEAECKETQAAREKNVDRFGVPWKQETDQSSFIHTFHLLKAPDSSGICYEPIMKDDGLSVDYHLQRSVAAEYPRPLYVRRLTPSKWKCMLADTLITAGGRCIAVQANFHLILAIFDDDKYKHLPVWLWVGHMLLFVAGVTTWALMGLRCALKGRAFDIDDSRGRRLYSIFASTILAMFAVPNDMTLVPIHMLSAEKGGLLLDSNYVQGNKKWPVHSIVHQHQEDHDYMNDAELSTMLPLFLFIDIGCSVCNVLTGFHAEAVDRVALFQFTWSFFYAFIFIALAAKHKQTEMKLLQIWRRTASDRLVRKNLQASAVRKYFAAGGSRPKLVSELSAQGLALEKGVTSTDWTIVLADHSGKNRRGEHSTFGIAPLRSEHTVRQSLNFRNIFNFSSILPSAASDVQPFDIASTPSEPAMNSSTTKTKQTTGPYLPDAADLHAEESLASDGQGEQGVHVPCQSS